MQNIKSRDEAIDAFVEMVVLVAKDDVTVSRGDALSAQHLTPAEPLNPKYGKMLKLLSSMVDPADYPEVDRRLEKALSAVTHFDSGKPFMRRPQLVLHVGEGLGKHIPEDNISISLNRMRELMESQAHLTGTEFAYASNSGYVLAAPELLRTESAAVRRVMLAFSQALASKKVLTVMTFSHGVVGAVLNAVVEVGMHKHLAICLHHADGGITVHGMDDEGFLEDWPYGVLDAQIDTDELKELGFTIQAN